MDVISIHEYTMEMIQEAATRIRQSFTEKMEIETKANANDLVTNIDKQTEQFIV